MSKLIKDGMGYGTTPNHILNDTDLSLKAKALWSYLESKPEGWDFSKDRIKEDHDDGRTAVMTGLQELEEQGYLRRERVHGENGHWQYEYHLYVSPASGNPTEAKSTSAESTVDEPTYADPTPKTKRSSKKEKVINSNSKNTMTQDQFEKFWEAYPRKVGKQKAKRKFTRLSRDKFDDIMQGLEDQKETTQWQKDDGQYIPHPTTWLNQGRWEDDPEAYNYEEDDKETGVAVKSY